MIGVALAPLKSQKVLTPGKPNLPAKALHMSLPYALLHFEAQKAKERVLQLFHTEPGAHSDNLSPTLARGGHERAERRGQRIGGLPNLWQGGRSNLRSIVRLVGRLSLSRQTNIYSKTFRKIINRYSVAHFGTWISLHRDALLGKESSGRCAEGATRTMRQISK